MSWLAQLAARRPRRIVTVAALVAVLAVVLGGALTGGLTDGGFQDPDAEATRADARIADATGARVRSDVIALVEPGGSVRSGPGQEAVERVAAVLRADADVARVVTPASPGAASLISRDGTKAYVVAGFRPISDDDASDAAGRLSDALAGVPGVTVGGSSVVGDEVGSRVGEDLARAELVAFPIIFLLSLWVFRGVVAALIPSIMGAGVILASFLTVGLLGQLTTLSIYALNLIIGLSLGLAIDYSLLIVSRYREELGRVGPGREALVRTLRTAGRSVLFSAITVAGALAGLMVFPQRFLFSMGVGGVVVAGVAGVAALLVLPAVLALLGTRVNALAPTAWRRRSEDAHRPIESGAWYRLSRAVLRRPGVVAALSAGVLIVAALPAAGIQFTTPDAGVLPADAAPRVVSDTIRAEFPQDRTAPLVVAVTAPEGPGVRDQLAGYAGRLRELPGAAAVTPPVALGPDTWRIDVLPRGEALATGSQDLVEDVRDVATPFPTLVGGQTATFVDDRASLGAHLPWAIGIVALATIAALFAMTGSVLLPLKAVVMNLLTLGATLGILVFIFQDGRLEGLLDFQSRGALDLTQPILLGALAFGLSTDYAVFLLSRIKEARDAGMDDSAAVASGIQRTGRIVTAAALLFAVAIGAFATSSLSFIKELGLGTALAVLIDATIIRAFVVPALMGLLGPANWWAPRPLRRLHRRLGLAEGEAAATGQAPNSPTTSSESRWRSRARVTAWAREPTPSLR